MFYIHTYVGENQNMCRLPFSSAVNGGEKQYQMVFDIPKQTNQDMKQQCWRPQLWTGPNNVKGNI